MKQVKIDNKIPDTFNSKSSISNIEITEWAFQGIRILYLDGDTAHKTTLDLNCQGGGIITVSYTHLTLPTSDLV